MTEPTGESRPDDAVAVAQQYRKHERPLSTLVGAVVGAGFIGTYLVTSLLPAVAVATVLVVVVRAPILRPHGTVELRSADPPEVVQAAFTGPTPPVLAFQWGIADDVTVENGIATYAVSYLFGLRSSTITVQSQTEPTTPAGDRVELTVLTNGHRWATYTAHIRADGDQTQVDVEYTADRRFGLRRLPQELVARHYRDQALEAQGYSVRNRDAHLR